MALISILLSHHQRRREIEIYLQTLFLVHEKRFWNLETDRKNLQKIYNKLFKTKCTPMKYRKVKEQLGVRCVYCFDVEKRKEKLYCKFAISSHMLFEINRNYSERPKLKRQFSQALQCLMLNQSGNVIIQFLDLRCTQSQINH